jgi:hypothetical protein
MKMEFNFDYCLNSMTFFSSLRSYIINLCIILYKNQINKYLFINLFEIFKLCSNLFIYFIIYCNNDIQINYIKLY